MPNLRRVPGPGRVSYFAKKSTGDSCGFLQLWHLCLLCELRLCSKVSQLRIWVDRPHTCRTAGVRREVFCFSGFFSCGKIHVTEKSPSQPCFSVQVRGIVYVHGVCSRHHRPPQNFITRNRSFGFCSRFLHPLRATSQSRRFLPAVITC